MCVPGFAGVPSTEAVNCDACPADTYADVHNMSQCLQCPENSSHNSTQRSAVQACVCDAGYTGPDGGPCVACAAGTFKAEPGTAACQDCSANEYSHTAAAACVSCHANSSSMQRSPGVEHCLCDPGFYPLHGACSMCRVGHFKKTLANEPCTSCAHNTFASELGATACTSCSESSPHSSSTPSEGGVRCQCNAGYTQTELELVTPVCSPCPADTFQPGAGTTSCEYCHASARSPEASVTPLACLCNAGFFDDNEHQCKACAGGTYKEAAVSDNEDTGQCSPCTMHSSSPAQSGKDTDCVCNAGFSGENGGPCVACPPGKFKAANGSAACEDCPLHTYSADAASTACSSCAALLQSEGGITHHVGQPSPESCSCDIARGFEQVVSAEGRFCSACKPGSYAADGGSGGGHCEDCREGTYTDSSGRTQCLHCPANMSSYDYPHIGCQCSKGFKCDAQKEQLLFATNFTHCLCDACPQSTFKNYTGAAGTCDVCQAHSVSESASVSQDDCLCVRGYKHDSKHTCVACAPGTYTDTIGEDACQSCPVDSYTPSEAAPWGSASDCHECSVCDELTSPLFFDHYDAARAGLGCGLDEPSDCKECPFAASLFQPSSAAHRNKGITSCVCDLHHYGDAGANCTRCPANQVRLDFVYANTTLADCHCAPGFEPDPDAANLCRACPIGTYKQHAGDDQCTACPHTLTTEEQGNANASACVCAPGYELLQEMCEQCAPDSFKTGFNLHLCQLCPAHATSPAGSDEVLDCTCAAGAQPSTTWQTAAPVCELCPAGTSKNATGNVECKQCKQDTAAATSGALACLACSAGTTTDGRSGQTECVCAVGTEPQDSANGTESLSCKVCRAGRFKTSSSDKYAHRECLECGACAAGEQVATECNSTHDVTCKACQAHSWSSAGRELIDPCFCDAGYELDAGECVACVVGKARAANANNEVPCAVCWPGFANTSAQATCHPCSATCEELGQFVRLECTASRDVVCEQCQTCGPRLYANNTCGNSYGNDRLDTQCVSCPENFFCPGGADFVAAVPCPRNSRSIASSLSITDCTCDAGFYRVGDECVLCPLDKYCPRGVFEPVTCPAPGRTLHEGSSVRIDCHCPRGYFRDPPGDEENFLCSLCTPTDYCYNNSLFNCSDPLMESPEGSHLFENCTCASRYYNNNTRCDDCPVDHFCIGGQQHACPAREWTAGRRRQEACVCVPGFARTQAGACVPCDDDFFCDGTDDMQHPCPHGARASLATNVSSCLCDVGREATAAQNASTPHTCQQCQPDFFKDAVSNTACRECTRCDPDTDSVWTRIICDGMFDAACQPCTLCHSQDAVGTADESWARTPCSQFVDTQCAVCTSCDHSEEWQKMPCSETNDRVCLPIQRDRVCQKGQYAGNHTHSTDSECLPCRLNDTLYEGQHLHFYTSTGRRYDDATSCDVSCRPFSRLRDPANPALGCVSCETGNVLFKIFVQNDTECQFSCVEGYARRGDDCELLPLQASASSFWNHSLNVTHVRRVSVAGAAAFRFTVSHTSHGSFAVVVGPLQPSCKGRIPTLLHDHTACCFSGLWRVSTRNQMGLASNAVESCSMPDPPPSLRISSSQLEFDVPDDRLTELAQCKVLQNSSYGELDCILQVSIVDTVLLHHVSVAVPLQLRRGASLAFLPGAHTYVPLLSFHAEVQLAYTDAGSPVFLVITDTVPLPSAGATLVTLSSGLELVQPPADVNCRRYAGHTSDSSIDSWPLHGAPARASTFLRAPAGTSLLKLYYTLRLLEREGTEEQQKNIMNIAVWRNLTLEHAVCEAPPVLQITNVGEVLSCSGLGAAAVATAKAVHAATETVRGELGGLTSFVARALHEHVREVRASSILAAFALPPEENLLQSVAVQSAGRLDFTETFRAACAVSARCHFSYVHGNGVHFMRACDAAGQNEARAWLVRTLGLVHDAGHVQALCAMALRKQYANKDSAFLITMVNTRAFMPRSPAWHNLQNRAAPMSTSKVFALFEFE